ncbi:MAG: phosphatase PAP2 family protein [Bacteroidia bacterium]|nr:phosphatase PAP2 family protein [Bacteroidia bacterium]
MKKFLLYFILFAFTIESSMAQQPRDTSLFPVNKDYLVDSIPHVYKTKVWPSMIIPGALIVYGLTTIKNSGFYSSYQAKKDIQKAFGSGGAPVDDYLQLSPYVEFAALLLLKVKCKNDALNTALLIVKSEAVMLAIVFSLKYITKVERPDGSNTQSFPSGHTAESFLAATIVFREYRYKSPWYGIGAYALATTVGAYRMINNKHWESDVLVGAGIGILSANLVYATHLHRWGRKEVCLLPTYDGTTKGLMLSYAF